ncbi:MAG: hypothetical protein OEW75_07645 [Cyclobacteriaceae bacterium]|nr:hypothetical protein [Cyclobacteriaceae bacterium]
MSIRSLKTLHLSLPFSFLTLSFIIYLFSTLIAHYLPFCPIIHYPLSIIHYPLSFLHYPLSIIKIGSQHEESGTHESPDKFATCHGGYSQAVKPTFNWHGSIMAHAARDPSGSFELSDNVSINPHPNLNLYLDLNGKSANHDPVNLKIRQTLIQTIYHEDILPSLPEQNVFLI